MSDFSPATVADLLAAQRGLVVTELEALGDGEAAWHPAPGEWCAKECVGHLIEAERRGFAGRIRTILERDGPDCVAWDQVAVARERNDCARSVRALLDEFVGLRDASVALVRGLRPDQLGRVGIHPHVGELTVRDLIHEWVHHDRNHTKQLLSVVQARVWPSMGNARKFAEID